MEKEEEIISEEEKTAVKKILEDVLNVVLSLKSRIGKDTMARSLSLYAQHLNTLNDPSILREQILEPLLAFVEECCILGDDLTESGENLWAAYTEWCDRNRFRSMSRINFQTRLIDNFTSIKKLRKRVGDRILTLFDGVKLNADGKIYRDLKNIPFDL